MSFIYSYYDRRKLKSVALYNILDLKDYFYNKLLKPHSLLVFPDKQNNQVYEVYDGEEEIIEFLGRQNENVLV